jgi:hypothetical protein
MRIPRRIPFSIATPILALVLLPSATESRATTTPDAWNEAAGTLAARMLEHIRSGNTLALTIKNISSLEDDDVLQVQRALRTQLRSRGARLAGNKQAKVDVQVTLSENMEGYLWIAEIRDPSSSVTAAQRVDSPVVMVSVARISLDERHPNAQPLSIRKNAVYQQPDPILDVALLNNLAMVPAGLPVSPGTAPRILVLSLTGVSLYEAAEISETGGKNALEWRPKQSAPITRLHPWPRDPRGRIMVRRDSQFDAYLPGIKCGGSLEPILTLECHEGDEPWPLMGNVRESDPANSSFSEMGAYFTADRNFFDGRIKLDNGREVKTLPFSAAVVMPLNAGTHAGLTVLSGRASTGAVSVPGLLLSGLDGRAQLLNSNFEPVANVGGWGSEIVGLGTSCGDGWQVLASQERGFNEPDSVQAYEIVNRKPVPVSPAIEFAGPITELWPVAGGAEAIAISRNLNTAAYEAFRLSISCSQ